MFYSVMNLGHLRVFYYIQVSILGKFIGKLIKMANFDLLPDNLILDILNYLPVKELCLSGR